ncbi:carboxy-terminal kinesin 2-like isoform X1 [Tubulanus polymorphus]|uniref:carboxy-terminal kinesin 2-like isoform X1 n=1 Tax=Tubulanus polymorphus TaxID=672921 RepID=UPI003DA69CB1
MEPNTNRSKLPMLRSAVKSRLPAPTSTSKSIPPPLPTLTSRTKRSRSPVNATEPGIKRQRLDAADHSKPTGPRLLRKANSVGALHPPRTGTNVIKKDLTSRRPTAPTTNRKPPVNTATSQQRAPLSRLNPPTKKPTTASANSAAAAAAAPAAGKKRPAWDMKGRLSDAQEQLEKKKALLSKQQNEFEQATSKLKNLEDSISQKDQQIQRLQTEKITMQTEANDLKKQIDETNVKFVRIEQEKEELKTTLDKTQSEKTSIEDEARQLQQQLKTATDDLVKVERELKGQLEELNNNCTQIKLEKQQVSELFESTRKNLEDMTSSDKQKAETIEKQKIQILEHETNRRKLHNTIQELRGNIRVFCRVRPLIGEELKITDGVISHMNFPDQEDNKVLEMERLDAKDLNETTMSSKKKHEFTFDRVFNPESKQEDAFLEISQLVQSALDGYNVCIFAYGQTGSGKTYTMEGGPDALHNADSRGMIPRAVEQVFDASIAMKENGWQFTFEVSFLEIYNETIRDLLGNDGINSQTKHEIKIAGNNSHDVMVTNLTTISVESADQVLSLLLKASRNRAVAETKCNARSSRSHSVFIFKLSCKNSITHQSYEGVLNLVDLAGSERLKESGSEGDRLKETQAINKSLSNLGNVIMALGNKDPHIPYRNSKLTYLLKNSLGGNSKTLMFINVSPKVDSYNETLNSLRFATKVNQCHIGVAQKKSLKKPM